jgi:ssDNA-binding Zn-finger/Zn-ribbon topoisomerase 1
MWLRYGVSQDNTLVSIEDSPRGKTPLGCPYCGGELTAKKGQRKEHHFAHTLITCREVLKRSEQEIPYLPLYDNFNIWLTGKELEQLKKLWNQYGCIDKGICTDVLNPVFLSSGLLERNEYRHYGSYQFTKLGKIPVGGLSLMLFNQVQEPLLAEKLQQLEKKVQAAYLNDTPEQSECLSDLRIYRAEYRKILSNTLYYLQIDTDGKTFYKIGVTKRDLRERVAEVKQDLRLHFQQVSIKVLGTWQHRGNVEKYFKYRYAGYNYPIGSLTEYYKFENQEAKAALTDLRRMKVKILSLVEADIFAGKSSRIEQLIEEEEKAERRSQAIKTGMQRAALWGTRIGRPDGADSDEEFLAKLSSQKVVEALNEGLSLRQAAQKAGVAVNTVRKVKAALQGR